MPVVTSCVKTAEPVKAEEGCCLYDTDHVVCHSFLQRDTAVKCTHYTLEKTLYQLEIINKGSDWP